MYAQRGSGDEETQPEQVDVIEAVPPAPPHVQQTQKYKTNSGCWVCPYPI